MKNNVIEIKLARQRFKLFLSRGDVLKVAKNENGVIVKAYGYFNRFMNRAFWLSIED